MVATDVAQELRLRAFEFCPKKHYGSRVVPIARFVSLPLRQVPPRPEHGVKLKTLGERKEGKL